MIKNKKVPPDLTKKQFLKTEVQDTFFFKSYLVKKKKKSLKHLSKTLVKYKVDKKTKKKLND